MSGVIGVGSIEARGEIWSPDNPNQAIEKRIERIVSNIERLRKAQATHDKLLDNLNASHKALKKTVEQENKNMEENIHSDLETLHTSDLITSLVGLIWLTVGISMSTMSPELYKLVQWIK